MRDFPTARSWADVGIFKTGAESFLLRPKAPGRFARAVRHFMITLDFSYCPPSGNKDNHGSKDGNKKVEWMTWAERPQRRIRGICYIAATIAII